MGGTKASSEDLTADRETREQRIRRRSQATPSAQARFAPPPPRPACQSSLARAAQPARELRPAPSSSLASLPSPFASVCAAQLPTRSSSPRTVGRERPLSRAPPADEAAVPARPPRPSELALLAPHRVSEVEGGRLGRQVPRAESGEGRGAREPVRERGVGWPPGLSASGKKGRRRALQPLARSPRRSAAAILGSVAAGSPSRLSPLGLLCRLRLAESVGKAGGPVWAGGGGGASSPVGMRVGELGQQGRRDALPVEMAPGAARPPSAASVLRGLEGTTWAGGAASDC